MKPDYEKILGELQLSVGLAIAHAIKLSQFTEPGNTLKLVDGKIAFGTEKLPIVASPLETLLVGKTARKSDGPYIILEREFGLGKDYSWGFWQGLDMSVPERYDSDYLAGYTHAVNIYAMYEKYFDRKRFGPFWCSKESQAVIHFAATMARHELNK